MNNMEAIYNTLVTTLAQATPEAAPVDGAGKSSGGSDPFGGFGIMIPLVLMFVVMYFLMIRPQRKQEKQRRQMLSQIAKNDHVMTLGGMHGIVYAVEENDVVLKIDERNDVRVRVAKAAVSQVLDKAEGGEAAKSA